MDALGAIGGHAWFLESSETSDDDCTKKLSPKLVDQTACGSRRNVSHKTKKPPYGGRLSALFYGKIIAHLRFFPKKKNELMRLYRSVYAKAERRKESMR